MRANTAEPSRRRGEGEGAREREGEREPKRRTVAVVTAVALRGKIGLACKVQLQREWVTKQQWADLALLPAPCVCNLSDVA